MATQISVYAAGTVIGGTQIRGPALLGPLVNVKDPRAAAGPALSDPDLLQEFLDAVALNAGPVSVLMASSPVDTQRLSSRWPSPLLAPGWLVGLQTSEAELRDAFTQTGIDGQLRILVARTFNEVIALADEWPSAP